ncbi:MAG: hypothetical protein KDA71_08175, partial [Planctomycetales bacterium]|nr:hypothetical protein [Planctomycetales bacterium]
PNALSWRTPKVGGLELFELPETTTRLQALITGQIDVAVGMGPDEEQPIAQSAGHIHQRTPHDVISLTFVIGTGGPLDDVRVRRALNYAVDKDAIANVILAGRTKPATQGAVRGLFGYNPDLEAYPYDPDKARALLKDAGYEHGFAFTAEIIISSNANDSLVYQFVADNLAQVGVKLNLSPIPTSQMIRVINQGEWRGNAFSQIFGSWPTFEPVRTLRLHSCLWPNPWYCDEHITPVIKAALTEPDLNRRELLTRQILKFYHDEATALLLQEIPLIDGVGKRVRNYNPQKGKINYETIELDAP